MKSIRPPIIVVLGHVDHGKTTLLDHIRGKYVEKSRPVAEREAGGITQSIGAYEITRGEEKFTFIDTPGHEAFSIMRSCGVEVADIAILLVAANDGVKPQTKEAFQCIKNSNIPYVVAINKTDLTEANVEKTKADLAQLGVYLEGQGGNVSFQEISAKTGEGVEDLLNLLSLAAEVEEFTFDSEALAEGFVLTSGKDARRGIHAGVVLKNGTLRRTKAIVTASAEGSVKILEGFLGVGTRELRPSAPALVLGWNEVPKVGEVFFSGDDAPELRVRAKKVEQKLAREDISTVAGEGVLNILLKADESGSLEALRGVVGRLSKDAKLHIVGASVGDVTETDVKQMTGGDGLIVGFRSKVDKGAENMARAREIEICTSGIIYELEKQVGALVKKLFRAPAGVLEVLATFGERSGTSQVVGGKVMEGVVKNQSLFEIRKEEEVLGSGKIKNLQAEKEDVFEVAEGSECGTMVESDAPIVKGNVLYFFDE